MEEIQQKNYAFIDGQNLNLAIQDSGWKLDFKILVPNSKKYSGLLKKSAGNNLAFINELKKKLEFKEAKKKRTS